MIWFTADWHLGCEGLVSKTRPFSSCDAHDQAVIACTNEYVHRDDILYIIGDFCYKKPGRYRPRIRCKNQHFILGNHDHEPKIRRVFGGNVWHQRVVKAKYGKVVCAHHPQAFWDQCFRGSYHAYGHLHNDYVRELMMNRGFPERRSMDVGIDHAYAIFGEYRPFSEEEFFALLRTRIGHDIIEDHK